MSKHKVAKAPTLHFQNTHTRNSKDWSFKKTGDGRLAFVSNHKGVAYRIGLLITFIGNHPGSNAEDCVAHLQTFDPSYGSTDLAQPFRQMAKIGILTSHGRASATTYRLSPKGAAIWKNTNKVWI